MHHEKVGVLARRLYTHYCGEGSALISEERGSASISEERGSTPISEERGSTPISEERKEGRRRQEGKGREEALHPLLGRGLYTHF